MLLLPLLQPFDSETLRTALIWYTIVGSLWLQAFLLALAPPQLACALTKGTLQPKSRNATLATFPKPHCSYSQQSHLVGPT